MAKDDLEREYQKFQAMKQIELKIIRAEKL